MSAKKETRSRDLVLNMSELQTQLLSKIDGKYFHFTINNWVVTDLITCLPPKFDYVVMGQEIAPETGTPHLQCYAIVSAQHQRATLVKKAFPNASNIAKQKPRGSISQSVAYCKKDGKFVEFGVQPPDQQPGKRNDLQVLGELARNGASDKEMMEEDYPTWARNHNALTLARNVFYVPKVRPDIQVILKYGETRMGKTYDSRKEYPDLYKKPLGKGLWFDGYAQQRVVFIDEFSGQWPLTDVLQLLDSDPVQVEVKGGHAHFDPDVIVLATNDHPNRMYTDSSHSRRAAFFARLKTIHYYTGRNQYLVLNADERLAFLHNPNWVPKPNPNPNPDPNPSMKRKCSSEMIIDNAKVLQVQQRKHIAECFFCQQLRCGCEEYYGDKPEQRLKDVIDLTRDPRSLEKIDCHFDTL